VAHEVRRVRAYGLTLGSNPSPQPSPYGRGSCSVLDGMLREQLFHFCN
jgi:hypothetical protein